MPRRARPARFQAPCTRSRIPRYRCDWNDEADLAVAPLAVGPTGKKAAPPSRETKGQYAAISQEALIAGADRARMRDRDGHSPIALRLLRQRATRRPASAIRSNQMLHKGECHVSNIVHAARRARRLCGD